MRYLYYAAVLFLLSVLQPTLVEAIAIFEVNPNLFLVFVLLVGFFRGKWEGAVCGLLFGLVFDLLVGRLIGLDAILYMYMGFCTGMLSENYFQASNLFITLLAAAAATLVCGLVYYLAYWMLWDGVSLWTALYRTILPECVYNTAFAAVLFFAVRKTMRLLRMEVH